MNPNLRLGQ